MDEVEFMNCKVEVAFKTRAKKKPKRKKCLLHEILMLDSKAEDKTSRNKFPKLERRQQNCDSVVRNFLRR